MHELETNINNQIECVAIKLDPGEHFHMIIRKHWIILVEVVGFLFILIVLSVGIFFLGQVPQIPMIFIYTSILAVWMIGLQYTFVHWINDELDVLILTNRRVITLDQIKFLDRKLSQTTLDNIQEVSSSTSGFIGNVLGYGNLIIKTASDRSDEDSDFKIVQIPDPIETSRKMHSFIDEYRHEIGQ